MTETERIRGLIQRRIAGLDAAAARYEEGTEEHHRWALSARALRGLLVEVDAGVTADTASAFNQEYYKNHDE